MDQQTVVHRRTVNVNTFAQVPLLNPSQLVTSWREILPPLRDADVRRIPIDVKKPGMYVVEAVLPPHMAYTVVIVSDIGLVTKASPGQVLLYAADRNTGKPVSGCTAQVLHNQKVLASGQSCWFAGSSSTVRQPAWPNIEVSVGRPLVISWS